jgi:serine/threonine protein kinase
MTTEISNLMKEADIIGFCYAAGEPMIDKLLLSYKGGTLFLKICKYPNPKFEKTLKHELRIINYLHNLGIKGIPNIVSSGYYQKKFFILEEFIEGDRYNSLKHSNLLVNWLRYVYRKTICGYIEFSKLLKKIEDKTRKVAPNEANLLHKIFHDELKQNFRIPLVFVHGDLYHDNIIVKERIKSIYITDYTLSEIKAPPGDPFIYYFIESNGSIKPNTYLSNCKYLISEVWPNGAPDTVTFKASALYTLISRIEKERKIRKLLTEEMLFNEFKLEIDDMFLSLFLELLHELAV